MWKVNRKSIGFKVTTVAMGLLLAASWNSHGSIVEMSEIPKTTHQPFLADMENNSATLLVRLQAAVDKYQRLQAAGGWQTIGIDGLLELGDSGADVFKLVNRLLITGDIDAHRCTMSPLNTETVSPLACRFDSRVESAVKRFQQRHGLKVDGRVGQNTLNELNIPVEHRLNQLTINYHRISSFPGITDPEYVYVNIPEFKLRYVESGKIRLTNNVVVGKPIWETPSMSDTIEKFVINPTWKIPLSIATKEIAPKAVGDPEYIDEANIEIRKASYNDTDTIDPNAINWDEVTPFDFDYFLVKRAGEENPMGEIKYLFPNKDAIYVHDTPAKNWFERNRRAASHGCIRMEDPFSLAESFARFRGRDELIRTMEEVRESGETKTFYLDKPVPIHLVYWTAWVDHKNTVHFRHDIYDRDRSIVIDPNSMSVTRNQGNGAISSITADKGST